MATPEVIQEFTSAIFEVWTRKHKIKSCFIQPRKPTQNTLVERFNGSYRKELLNAHYIHRFGSGKRPDPAMDLGLQQCKNT